MMEELFSVSEHQWNTRACGQDLKNGEMKRKLSGSPKLADRESDFVHPNVQNHRL
jgi:hypothetical protein